MSHVTIDYVSMLANTAIRTMFFSLDQVAR